MFTISIQSGGSSSRMGKDKALLSFLGIPLIQRVSERVAYLADEVIVTTNNPEEYQFLGVPIFPDLLSDVGALSGLYTALVYASHPLVGVIACDLPFANPCLLAACRDILQKNDGDAVIPSSRSGLEPLHAVYRKETCLPLVKAALSAGKRRMIAWHEDADIHILTLDDTAACDPYGVAFWNVNTPEAFREAERKALELERH